jgi:DNA-binding NarL/FixJ family response regulator
VTIAVFLADDHAVVRDGLRFLLGAQHDIEVVGDAADGHQAVRRVSETRPDVVLVDIAMPGLNGIETTRQICENCADTRVIILSMYSTTEHIFRALQAGAQGYVLKESAGVEVVDAVRTVHGGLRYLSPKVADAVVHDYVHQRDLHDWAPLESLSSRELEVLQLVAEGKSSADIADLLSLSPKTVDTYRSRLMRKLDLDDLPSLVKFAIRHGLTTLD